MDQALLRMPEHISRQGYCLACHFSIPRTSSS